MAKQIKPEEDKVDKMLGMLIGLLILASICCIFVASVGGVSKMIFDVLYPEAPV